MKDKLITYHQRSEEIFLNRMPKVAEAINKLKPHIEDLGIGLRLTDVGIDLLNNKKSGVNEHIDNYAQSASGGIKYVEEQIKTDINRKINLLSDVIADINKEIDFIKPPMFNFSLSTLDKNECLNVEFLSIDKDNDLFVCDDEALERVKPRFEVRLSGEGLAMYEDLQKVTKLFSQIKENADKLGFHRYFSPEQLINYNDDSAEFEINIYQLHDDFKFLTREK